MASYPFHRCHAMPVNQPFCVTPLASAAQMVFDPSNLRPVAVCVAIAGGLAGLYLLARARSVADAAEKRRRMYYQSGSFSPSYQQPEIPADVGEVTGSPS